jgi:hypothetical protein
MLFTVDTLESITDPDLVAAHRLAQTEAAHLDPTAPAIFLLARGHKPNDRSKP